MSEPPDETHDLEEAGSDAADDVSTEPADDEPIGDSDAASEDEDPPGLTEHPFQGLSGDAISSPMPKIDFSSLLGPMFEKVKPTFDAAKLWRGILPGISGSGLWKDGMPSMAMPSFAIPSSIYTNLYGNEFGKIARGLVDFGRFFEGIDWSDLTTNWLPPNWDPERSISQYEMFIELGATECLPLTWVPNTELTYLLVDADAAARTKLLSDSATTILSDCRDLLDDLESTFLTETLGEALTAYLAGHHRLAQAGAASIMDTALRHIFRDAPSTRFYSTVKPRFQTRSDWESTVMRAARTLPTSVAVLATLTQFKPETGDPIPLQPNRHATAHAVHVDQYTSTNALKFIMLTAAVLAEIEHGGWDRMLASAD
ncbi:MAG: hypothetical protein JWR52_181 [Marmoricola sp.]|nr:hypothetical protein [Marmoricola sp.]